MSISTKIPQSFLFHNSITNSFKPTKFPSLTSPLHTFYCKPITIHRISTKPPISASSQSISNTLQPIEELPPKLQEIVKLFQGVEDPRAKYEQILFYGRKLKPLDSKYKINENKVQGCVSQVWVRAYLDEQGKNVYFEADSDALTTKGLAAMLVQGFSGRPVEEVSRVRPDFVVLSGLQQSLSPSRNNGFLNLLKLMQRKASDLLLYGEIESVNNLSTEVLEKSSLDEDSGLENDIGNVGESSEIVADLKNITDDESILGDRGMRIRGLLEKELRPVKLEVDDISYQHAGHAGVQGSDGETHFNVRVVSEEFEGKSLVKRHRLIYSLLQDELQGGLHALSIVAKTPAEVGA